MQTGNPLYCSQIVRDPNTFYSLQGATIAGGGYVVQTNQNIASVLQSGIDLQTSYKSVLSPGFGAFDWAIDSRWRHTMRTTWTSPWDTDLSAIWRFIGKVGNEGGGQANTFATYDTLGRQIYIAFTAKM